MLRVTTLYASSAVATAAYYTRYLAGAPGEEPGRWLGRQADGLGLAGRVEADELQVLLEGRHPCDGRPLGSVLVDRETSEGRVVRAVAGFDATFSAPKSLSVWWAITGDPGLLDAHDAAVTATLGYLERYGATPASAVTVAACIPTPWGSRWRHSARPPPERTTHRSTPTP